MVVVVRHLLKLQHCFLRPTPPNFGISLHDVHWPQFSRRQAKHEPHLFLFLPTNDKVSIRICTLSKSIILCTVKLEDLIAS